MKSKSLCSLLALGALLVARLAAEDAAPSPAVADLNALEARISAKERAGKDQPADFAEEFAAFDTLLAKYKDQKSEDVAAIALTKAVLYWDVVNDPATTEKVFRAVTTGFPDTKTADQAEKILAANATLAALPGKPAPELHFKWSSQAGLTSLAALKGKIVVLDFWATWCGPCIRSFPAIREHVARFKDAPVVFLSVTSI